MQVNTEHSCGDGCGHGADCKLPELMKKLHERTAMLHQFIGMAQEQDCPSLEMINRGRASLGWGPITDWPFSL